MSKAMLAAFGMVLLWGQGPVWAQDEAQDEAAAEGRESVAGHLDTIVVRARQRQESLRDVPATVNVLTEETLERAGVERAEDFINLTPGVSIVDAAEVGDTQVNIRGINGARDAENSFAFIVDGILLTNPAAFNREFTDLAQIEILKGPQGALYGRNAAAGAIIVTTKEPTNEFEAMAEASFANHDSYYVNGRVSGPIVEDRLFFRLSGDWRTSDGFYRNSFLDADVVDDFENYNVNGRLVWKPADNLDVDIKARYGEVDAASISFNAAFAFPNLAALFGVPEFFEDVNDHDFVFQPNIDPSNDQQSFEISAKADYEMRWATLTGWFLYSDVDQNFLADGTSGAFGFFFDEPSCEQTTADLTGVVTLPPPQFLAGAPEISFYGPYTPTTCDGYQYQVRNQGDYSFEVRLTSPGDRRLRWLFGGYYLDIDRQVGVATLVDDNTAPIPSLINDRTEQLVYDDFDSRIYAVFGQLAYDLTDTVELSAALRYDNEFREVTNLVPSPAEQVSNYIDFDGPPFTGDAPLNPGFLFGPIEDQEETFDQLQPKLSVSWDATDNMTLFANWGIGFKSGGFNNQGSQATIDLFINDLIGTDVQVDDVFDKEKSSAFEWGFKATGIGGMLDVEGAGYYTQVDNMQFFEFFVGGFGLLRVVTNIDEVEIFGGELAANVGLTDWLSAYAAGNVTFSEIKQNSTRPDTVGNESPFTPKFTVNVGLQVDKPVTGNLNFVGRADVNVVGPTWFHTVQDETRPTIFQPNFGPFLSLADYSRVQRDTYYTLNLRAGVETENWGVFLFAKNVTDEEYLEEVITAPEFGGSFIHPGAKRLWGAEVVFRY